MKKLMHRKLSFLLAILCNFNLWFSVGYISYKERNVAETPFPSFSLEGHRGCRGLMPENTIPAMKKAIDLGVTTLEMDVVISKDQKVVVSHDNYINSDFCLAPDGKELTKIQGENLILYQMSYDSIAKFDTGMKPYPSFPGQQKISVHKPLLKDLIAASELYTKQNKTTLKWYNIETKTQNGEKGDGTYQPNPETFVDLLVAVIRKSGIEKRTVIQSFDTRTLKVLKQKYPYIKTSFLVLANDSRNLKNQIDDLGYTPFIYSPDFKSVNPDLVQNCHKMGMKIIPWTVNSRDDILRMKSYQVDGIISDYPNNFQGL